MNISLLISLFPFFLSGPQVPNNYRSYPTARAEAEKAGKEMLIFFSSSSCTNCQAAWNAFTKDVNAVNKYVSTQVVADNFDGQILYDYFDPGNVPAWVLLDANGAVKERWQGGWKDAYGNGTLFVEETPMTETVKKTETALNTKSVSTTAITTNTNSTPATKPTAPTTTPAKESVAKTETKMVTQEEKVTTTSSASSAPSAFSASSASSASSAPSAPSSGFIIQVGYFGSEANAQKCLTDLKSKGFTQFSIKPLEQNGSTFYRVWSSAFPTESAAQAKLQELTNAGIKGTVKSAS